MTGYNDERYHLFVWRLLAEMDNGDSDANPDNADNINNYDIY